MALQGTANTRFFLVRHGRAEASNPGGDAARRLVLEAREELTEHFRALEWKELEIDRVFTSPFVRARETAEILTAATGAPLEESEALASGKSTGPELLRLGARLGRGAALVGHNPEIAEAVSAAAGRKVDVPPGAVAAIEADGAGFRLAWLRAPA
ncbi:MAG TPA: histidine phosphatase family protein [Anaeromyxobacter sp.]